MKKESEFDECETNWKENKNVRLEIGGGAH